MQPNHPPEPFGCLSNSDYHPWVRMIFQSAYVGVFLQSASHFPALKNLLLRLIPSSLKRKRQENLELTKAKLQRRIETGPRPDLIEGLLRKKEEWNLSLERLESNSMILIVGGSETTATLLSGATYYLLMNSPALAKLASEVRGAFESEADITIASVSSRLPYMLACLNEALRIYPPVSVGLPRIVPKEGAMIAGHYVPAGNTVAVWHWAMYHLEKNFGSPFEYRPERFMGDERFAGDRLEALQPFHTGGRNCLGKK